MDFNAITSRIISGAIEVHRELGPGLLESVYQQCLEIELREAGVQFQAQLPLQISYKGHPLEGDALRMDLLVENLIVVELKSVEKLRDVHHKQLLTYLRLADKRVGLLVNFNEALLKDGIARIANRLDESVHT